MRRRAFVRLRPLQRRLGVVFDSAYLTGRESWLPGAKPVTLLNVTILCDMIYSDEQIARIVHEANCALQTIQGDEAPSRPWDSEE